MNGWYSFWNRFDLWAEQNEAWFDLWLIVSLAAVFLISTFFERVVSRMEEKKQEEVLCKNCQKPINVEVDGFYNYPVAGPHCEACHSSVDLKKEPGFIL